MRTNLLRPYVADWHGHVPSRYATDPREELMRMENHSRYTAQSANSRDGEVAELPARLQLQRVAMREMSEAEGREYARQEMLDSAPTTDVHWSQA